MCGTINMFSLQKFVILYCYLLRTATSAQEPLSSVPKVAVVERFDGNNNINFIIN